jgi:periplasmic divalent cation tolerance protein
MSHRFIYVTTESLEQAKAMGRTLVVERLVACVNLLPQMTSIYRWQDRIEESSEVVLIAKTRESLVDQVIHRIQDLHTYECPCIVALPVAGGSEPFLSWIDSQTV